MRQKKKKARYSSSGYKKRLEYFEQLFKTIWNILYISEDLVKCCAEDTSLVTIERVIRTTLEGISSFLPSHFLSFYSLQQKTMDFAQTIVIPADCKDECEIIVDELIEEGFFAWGLKQQKTMVLKASETGESLLFVPVSAGRTISGIVLISLYNDADSIPREAFSLIDLVFRQVAFIIENIRLFTELQIKHVELEKTCHSVEEKVRERTAELEIMKERAEAASHAKNQFLANVSHEIRTPLNAVIGFAALLRDTDLNETQYDYIETIDESARLLNSLISDVLDVSKIEAREIHLESIPFNIRILLDNALKIIRPRLQGRDLTISYTLNRGISNIYYGDPTKIYQILINLLSNAIKFTEKGRINIELQRLEKKSDKDGSTSHMLQISVSDTGIGIAAENLHRIFDSFVQGDNSTTRRHGGTGLGLTITRAFVEKMGGSLWVDSEVGKGSTFTFTIMLKEATADHEWEIDPARLKAFSGKKVIIADDNKETGCIIREYCQKLEMDIIYYAHSLYQAAKWLETPAVMPDILLCNYLSYTASEAEILKDLKSVNTKGNLRFAAINYHDAAETCLQAGFDYCIPSPILWHEFVEVLEKAFSTRKAGRKIAKPDNACYGGMKILVAEDNKVNQKFIGHALKKLGCSYDIINDGSEALERLRGDHYNLILMDLQMPCMGGIETTELIRNSGYSELPIIALTAAAMSDDEEKCIKSGMNGYLTKPIDMDKLKETLLAWAKVPS